MTYPIPIGRGHPVARHALLALTSALAGTLASPVFAQSAPLPPRRARKCLMRVVHLLAAAVAFVPAAANAAETDTYGYDAKGRLTQVARSGSVNNGVTATYAFDRTDNRTNLTVTGSPFNSPAVRVVVVPLNGITVIPLGSNE